MAIDCATLSRSDLPRPFNCLYPRNLSYRQVFDTTIGQVSLPIIQAFGLFNSDSYVFSKQSTPSSICGPKTKKDKLTCLNGFLGPTSVFNRVPLLENLQGDFAEFLKINYPTTLELTRVSLSTA